jgi:hypothetical protein
LLFSVKFLLTNPAAKAKFGPFVVFHPKVNRVSSFVRKLLVANAAVSFFDLGMYDLDERNCFTSQNKNKNRVKYLHVVIQ